jgi:hexosaminidase
MNLSFSAAIEGDQIICQIGSDTALRAPIFCFSLMAAPRVVAGGQMLRRLAGYAEVILPDLLPGQSHQLFLAHDNPDYAPRNRAWLPLGAYLRVGKQAHPLPAGFDLGLRPAPVPPPPAPLAAGQLPLIPVPQQWQPATGALAFAALRPDPAYQGADDLARRMGLPPLLAGDGLAAPPQIDPALGPEGYRIAIRRWRLPQAARRGRIMPPSPCFACGKPARARCPAAPWPTARALSGAASIWIARGISFRSRRSANCWT